MTKQIMKYFDPVKKQLIFINQKATPDFWDSRWQAGKTIRDEIFKIKNTFASRITKQYLNPKDGIILEGGCGQGKIVASLVNNGYKIIGLDYAKKTVKMLNKYIPEWDIRFGDVRDLPFADNFFIGYWSLGVIEHFYEGYQPIAQEMQRVIKDGGYLFLTFPHMSCLRKIKSILGFYQFWPKRKSKNDFYQFALNSKLVIRDFQKLGFKFIKARNIDGIRGIKEEIPALWPSLKKLYDYRGDNVLIKIIKLGIALAAAPVAGHVRMLVFKK